MKKVGYHAGDFSKKYSTIRQGLSGTSFCSGYFYTLSKEACESQGTGFNGETKRPVYSFSLAGLSLLEIDARGCKTLNKFNKAMYFWPVWEAYFDGGDRVRYEEIYDALQRCFEDYYCDDCDPDIRAVKFFRELSDAYNIDKETDKDYTFQDFIENDKSLSKLADWLCGLEDDAHNTLPHMSDLLLEADSFTFTDDQELVDELDNFLDKIETAAACDKHFESVAKFLDVDKRAILNEAADLYDRYKDCYDKATGRFDNWRAPADDGLFATQLLISLGYDGTYPLGDADNAIWGGCIFDKDSVKDIKLVSSPVKESFDRYFESVRDTLASFDRVYTSHLAESTYDYEDLKRRVDRSYKLFDKLDNANYAKKLEPYKESFKRIATQLIHDLYKHFDAANSMNETGEQIENLEEFRQYCIANINFLKGVLQKCGCN